MTRALIVIGALLAVVYLPWQLAIIVLIASAFVSPLAPLAGGILGDTLSFAPHAYSFPFFTALGGAIALGSFFVRNFVETRIMRR